MQIKNICMSFAVGCFFVPALSGGYGTDPLPAGYAEYPFNLDTTEPFTKQPFRQLLSYAQKLGVDLKVVRLVTSEKGSPVVRYFLRDKVMPLVEDRFVDPVTGQPIVEGRNCVVRLSERNVACIVCTHQMGPTGPEGSHEGMGAVAAKREALLKELDSPVAK